MRTEHHSEWFRKIFNFPEKSSGILMTIYVSSTLRDTLFILHPVTTQHNPYPIDISERQKYAEQNVILFRKIQLDHPIIYSLLLLVNEFIGS